MICPYCSHENKGDDLFCGKCGRKLERKHSLVIAITTHPKEDSAFSAAADFTYRPEPEIPLPDTPDKGAPVAADTPGFAAAADLTYRPTDKERKKRGESAQTPADPADMPVFFGKIAGETPVSMEYRPKDPTIVGPTAECVPVASKVVPAFSEKKGEPDTEVPVMEHRGEEKPEVRVYQPVMPGRPSASWKKMLSLVLVLALVAGVVFCARDWDIFSGSSGNSSSKRSKRDDDDDDDDDRHQSQSGYNPGDYGDYGGFGEEDYAPGYEDSEEDLGYIDCSACVDGRCSNCMGDGDYAGVDCRNCDDGVCNLCDGYGIIFY